MGFAGIRASFWGKALDNRLSRRRSGYWNPAAVHGDCEWFRHNEYRDQLVGCCAFRQQSERWQYQCDRALRHALSRACNRNYYG